MYICLCCAVSDRDIRLAVARGACTRRQINECRGIGLQCRRCRETLRATLQQALAEQAREQPAAG
jgi:bacterioferritin-associated ferredoxin